MSFQMDKKKYPYFSVLFSLMLIASWHSHMVWSCII